jgi:hypothetical protein
MGLLDEPRQVYPVRKRVMLGNLPRFLVVGLHANVCDGVFDPSSWVCEDGEAGLILGGSRFLWGQFSRIDEVARTCSITLVRPADSSLIVPGNSYPFVDGYWGEPAELVLEESRTWNRLTFEPSDMVVLPSVGGSSVGSQLTSDVPLGGKVVAGGWDHEHCNVCGAKIGHCGAASGYFSEPASWVCEACYATFVMPRSLAFCIG